MVVGRGGIGAVRSGSRGFFLVAACGADVHASGGIRALCRVVVVSCGGWSRVDFVVGVFVARGFGVWFPIRGSVVGVPL